MLHLTPPGVPAKTPELNKITIDTYFHISSHPTDSDFLTVTLLSSSNHDMLTCLISITDSTSCPLGEYATGI
jgi:hypothetical protein